MSTINYCRRALSALFKTSPQQLPAHCLFLPRARSSPAIKLPYTCVRGERLVLSRSRSPLLVRIAWSFDERLLFLPASLCSLPAPFSYLQFWRRRRRSGEERAARVHQGKLQALTCVSTRWPRRQYSFNVGV